MPRRPHSRRSRAGTRARAGTTALAFVLVLAACAPGPTAPPPPPPAPAPAPAPTDPGRVVLYGDAVAAEVRAPLATRLAGVSSVLDRAGAGFAVCDVLPSIATDAANTDIDVAVLQFSGDTSTPCMAAATTDPARTTTYQADLDGALDALTADPDRTVFVVSSPLRWSATPGVDEPVQLAFQAALEQVVVDWLTAHVGSTQVVFIDAGAAVASGGSFAWALPCVPGETIAMGCRSGADTIAVRAPDGRGFCPIAPQLACPPHYSGGARRYLDVFADQVLALL